MVAHQGGALCSPTHPGSPAACRGLPSRTRSSQGCHLSPCPRQWHRWDSAGPTVAHWGLFATLTYDASECSTPGRSHKPLKRGPFRRQALLLGCGPVAQVRGGGRDADLGLAGGGGGGGGVGSAKSRLRTDRSAAPTTAPQRSVARRMLNGTAASPAATPFLQPPSWALCCSWSQPCPPPPVPRRARQSRQLSQRCAPPGAAGRDPCRGGVPCLCPMGLCLPACGVLCGRSALMLAALWG